jgi:hypothetical protein
MIKAAYEYSPVGSQSRDRNHVDAIDGVLQAAAVILPSLSELGRPGKDGAVNHE